MRPTTCNFASPRRDSWLTYAAMIRCFYSLVAPVVLSSAVFTTAFAESVPEEVRPLVVKIHTTQRFPDVFRPWTQREAEKVSGSGAVIAGNKILTNAHVVRNATEIYVQPYQSSDMLEARVIAVAPGIDLAVIELEDPSFFATRGHVEVDGDTPKVKDKVSVYGYPMGGSELSVTEGIVSRIEFTSYYEETSGLRLQVDAALNPGNSGGPAFANGKVIGLVFSGVPASQSIGYLIPAEEIKLFLQDVADGHYGGKPMLFDSLQTMENSAVREKLALPRDKGGFMVIAPFDDEDGQYPLRRWDVLTQIGDFPLDSQGNVKISDNLRLDAKYLLQRLTKDGKLPCKIWRDGAEIDVAVPVRYQIDQVIPALRNDRPRYFIYGPLVFSVVTQELVGQLGDRGRYPRGVLPLVARLGDRPEFPDEEIVVVCSRVFSHPITKGYDEPFLFVIAEINGVKVKNLRHLVEILRDMPDRFVALTFAGVGSSTPEIPVFEHARMLAATETVINDNGIRSPSSDDIAKIWNAKP